MAHWYAMVAVFGVSVLVAELGFRLGRRTRAGLTPDAKTHAHAMLASILGLLALLLGFSFGMAISRYDLRKAVILHESNAIGTAYLRTSWLREPQRQEIRALFRRYVDARVDFYRAGDDEAKTAEAIQRGRGVQGEIWSRSVAAVEEESRQALSLLFIQALNDMIDLEAERIAAIENHVPVSILALLVFATIVASGTTGYACGISARRAVLSMVLLPLLVAVVIGLIIDLDRPRIGLIQVGQAGMLRVQQAIAESAR